MVISKVYILKVQGFGDSEDEFVNYGVYRSRKDLDNTLSDLQAEWAEDGLDDVVTDIEEWEIV